MKRSWLVMTLMLMSLLASNIGDALTPDGLALLEFKSELTAASQDQLRDWAPLDASPCAWRGVTCDAQRAHVVHLNLSAQAPTRLQGTISAALGDLRMLQRLDLSQNRLTGTLPQGLGRVFSLDVSGNDLTGGIFTLSFPNANLAALNLARNGFYSVLPPALGKCTALRGLDLSDNAFTGRVPIELEDLDKLEVLRLARNGFTELDARMYSRWAPTLVELHLAENPWATSIAPEIGGLGKLVTLNLSRGLFRGRIPASFQQLTRLQSLDLSNNELAGEIPHVLGEKMESLTEVNLAHNNLMGALPPQWVKFLVANPDAFAANPYLCVQYDAENRCQTTPPLLERPTSSTSENRPRRGVVVSVGVIVGVALAVTASALAIFLWAVLIRRRKSEDTLAALPPSPSSVSVRSVVTSAPLPFTYESIMAATEDLSDAHVIGRGSNGVVYKATLATDQHIVVKRIDALDMKTDLVHKSFWKEIESLTRVTRHRNVVTLLGYIHCPDEDVALLLYEYVANGDLRAALHDPKLRGQLDLDWSARLRIAQGVACGLAYLHNTSVVVHRDITSSNVLLDEDLTPRISDFGLSKVVDRKLRSQWSSTSPVILGTYGYIAPEVGYTNVITPKLDVYSYGVLLLELLTGKKPTDKSFGKSLHVAAWVKEKVQQNEWRMSESVLDPALLQDEESATATRDEMLAVQRIALLCTRENPADRPAMREVEEMFQKLSEKRNQLNVGDENV